MNNNQQSRVTSAVRGAIRSQRLIEPGARVLLAFSGGTDSSVLYEILRDLQEEMDFTLVCAHLDHGFRESSARERDWIRKRCLDDGVEVFSARIDVRAYAREHGLGEEEAARTLRYRYFEHLIRRHGIHHLALAHHQNDQAETLLFRLARGCGLRGAGAMKRVQKRDGYTIIRPMLGLSRREIEEELRLRGVRAVEDESNQSLRYARNRIRHEVIPQLEAAHPGALASLARSADIFQEEEALLELLLAPFYQKYLRVGEKSVHFLPQLYEDPLDCELPQTERKIAASPAFRYALIREGARSAGLTRDLSQAHVHAVDELFRGGKTGVIDLPGGYQAGRGQKRCWIGKKTRQEGRSYPLADALSGAGPGGEIVSENGRRIFVEAGGDPARNATSGGKKINKYTLSYDMINNSLVFRRRRPGDYIRIHQGMRKKKLKRFFIDSKIDKELRDDLLMLADGAEILWIPGLYARDKKVRADLKKIDAKELHLVAEGYEYD